MNWSQISFNLGYSSLHLLTIGNITGITFSYSTPSMFGFKSLQFFLASGQNGNFETFLKPTSGASCSNSRTKSKNNTNFLGHVVFVYIFFLPLYVLAWTILSEREP